MTETSETLDGASELPNYRISDQATFDNTTGAGHELAGLYAWAKLDCLIRLARLVSLDFFTRPEYYKQLDPDVVRSLAELNARYGSDEQFPSDEQRHTIFTPLFEDAAGDFVRDRDGLLSAAATYSEWGQATGQVMLREAVRTTHTNFIGQLTLFNGASVNWSREVALPHLANDVSYSILRDPGVTAVFGVANEPGDDWPYSEDANGDQLVEEISRRLDPNKVPPLTRHDFRLQQRAALRGAEAIAAILDFKPGDGDAALDELITRCYTWYAALQGATGMGRVAANLSNTSDGDRRAAGAASFLPV
jgi:hypothetical protein